jgi:hypothetical protein
VPAAPSDRFACTSGRLGEGVSDAGPVVAIRVLGCRSRLACGSDALIATNNDLGKFRGDVCEGLACIRYYDRTGAAEAGLAAVRRRPLADATSLEVLDLTVERVRALTISRRSSGSKRVDSGVEPLTLERNKVGTVKYLVTDLTQVRGGSANPVGARPTRRSLLPEATWQAWR